MMAGGGNLLPLFLFSSKMCIDESQPFLLRPCQQPPAQPKSADETGIGLFHDPAGISLPAAIGAFPGDSHSDRCVHRQGAKAVFQSAA